MNRFKLLDINLNQFDEEGQSTEAATVEQEDTAGANDQQDSAEDQTPDIDAKFEELISGEYKEAFSNRTQKIINKRFAETKELETKHTDLESKYNHMSETLNKRFGTENVEDALSKIESESIENEAYERGVDVDVVRKERETEAEIRDLRNKNTELTKEKNTWHEREKQAEQIRVWKSQENELQSTYPDFKLAEAADNQKFVKLLQSGIDMKTAYEVAFPDKYTARVEGAVSNDPNKGRPKENAGETKNSGQFTLNSKSPGEMTAEERRAIADRAMKGEKITF